MFFTYLALYLAFYFLNGPVLPLERLFTALHLAIAGAFGWLIYRARYRFGRDAILFWAAVFLLLWWPGAYLEYPADPWEHVRRIFFWQNTDRVGDHPLAYKFAYFWNWTLLRFFPLDYRIVGLDLLNAFWQLLLGAQVYRLCRAWGQSVSLARFQVLGFYFFFGTNLFGIRYYALASTALSYFAFLEVVILAFRKPPFLRSLFTGACLALLMYFNHRWQEIGFALVFLAGISTFRFLAPLAARRPKLIVFGLFVFLALSFVFGWWIMQAPPPFYLQKGLVHYYSDLGTFRFWRSGLPYSQTLGIPGVLTLIGACLFYRRYGVVAFLTLVPFAFLSIPVFVFFLSLLISTNFATYRILFAFPTSFLFTWLIWDLVGWIQVRGSLSNRLRSLIALGLLILLALPWNYPWRGRLRFQIYRPPEQSIVGLHQLAQVFWDRRSELKGCSLYGDDVSTHYLATQLSLPHFPDRHNPKRIMDRVGPVEAFLARKDVFGVLIPDAAVIPNYSSVVAKRSMHWGEEAGSRVWYLDARIAPFEDAMLRKGWLKEQISGYRFYLNPARSCGDSP